MGGYMGKYLIINLSTGSTEEVAPGDEFYRKYLTGYGLGAAVVAERQKAGIDPLSAEAHLGFCSGLLTGTGAYFSGRFVVVGKSPLTGGWGDANSGGFFSVEIKKAGYDAVFFTGKAKSPVWVFINDGKVEIRDAKNLWGKDTVDTEELIRKELKDSKVQVSCIGKAGEKLSLISGIVTDAGRIAARSGLGAVMGSKKLKAVALKGTGKVPIANPEKLKELNQKFLKGFKAVNPVDKLMVKGLKFFGALIARTHISVPSQQSTIKEIFRTYGTSGATAYLTMIGDAPVKNWTGVGYTEFPTSYKLSDDSVIAYQKKRYACQACPLGCGGIVDIKAGRYKGTEGHKVEYETLASFGGLALHDDLDVVMEINELCNRAGIDTISTGGAVAFAIECFEKGIINEKATGGLKLGWGKSKEILALTEMIIDRKGLGDLLADGVKKAAKKLGRGAEECAVHAGGQELPMHDGRLDAGIAMMYQEEPAPGRHTTTSYLNNALYGVKKQFPGIKRMVRQAAGADGKNMALTAGTLYFVNAFNGSGMCHFGMYCSPVPFVEYLNAATGWNLSADDYLKTGERILNLRKAFNIREGVKPADIRLHSRSTGNPPLSKGPLKGKTIDMPKLVSAFYAVNGWDIAAGGPTKEKMQELGIYHLAR